MTHECDDRPMVVLVVDKAGVEHEVEVMSHSAEQASVKAWLDLERRGINPVSARCIRWTVPAAK